MSTATASQPSFRLRRPTDNGSGLLIEGTDLRVVRSDKYLIQGSPVAEVAAQPGFVVCAYALDFKVRSWVMRHKLDPRDRVFPTRRELLRTLQALHAVDPIPAGVRQSAEPVKVRRAGERCYRSVDGRWTFEFSPGRDSKPDEWILTARGYQGRARTLRAARIEAAIVGRKRWGT